MNFKVLFYCRKACLHDISPIVLHPFSIADHMLLSVLSRLVMLRASS